MSGSAHPDIDGKAAAAMLMMMLDDAEAASIVGQLDAQDVRALGTAMLGIAGANDGQIEAALSLFSARYETMGPLSGDPTPRVRAVIEKAVGVDRAASLLAGIAPIASPRLSQLLDWMDAEVIAAMLKREHPQVGALVVASLEPDVAATALAMIDESRQADLLLRAARLGKVSRDAVSELEVIVARYSGGDQAPPPKVELGGSSGVAKIVNNLGRPRGERLIKAIRKSDRPIADAIEEDMFVFEDLLDLDAKALGAVMRSVDASNLVFALKGASPELAERILASMSQRAADSIRDEMAERTMVKRSEVDAAQKAIIALTRQLADAGEIMLGSEGNDYV